MDPFVLAAHTSKYNKDLPNWSTATNVAFQEDFWPAMDMELQILEADIQSWVTGAA